MCALLVSNTANNLSLLLTARFEQSVVLKTLLKRAKRYPVSDLRRELFKSYWNGVHSSCNKNKNISISCTCVLRSLTLNIGRQAVGTQKHNGTVRTLKVTMEGT